MRRIFTLALVSALGLTAFGVGPAQAAVPDITGLSASPATIYPLVNTTARPGFTTITITGDPSTVADLEIRNSSSVKVRDVFPGGQNTASWDGRDATNHVVPAGDYTVFAIGSGSDVSPFTATVTVSGKKLITKTFTKTVTPAASLLRGAVAVGKCSTLKKPAKKAWKGSFGYYANTKCKTPSKSLVLTQHVLKVPGAEKYLTMRINTYGGAHKRGSKGLIIYMETGRDPIVHGTTSAKLGNHTGPLRTDFSQAFDHSEVSWVFAVDYKNQYDVKNFTVVIRYQVLG